MRRFENGILKEVTTTLPMPPQSVRQNAAGQIRALHAQLQSAPPGAPNHTLQLTNENTEFDHNLPHLSTALPTPATFTHLSHAHATAKFFLRNIVGKMNSVDDAQQHFASTLEPDLLEAVFGNPLSTTFAPRKGLTGIWEEARLKASKSNRKAQDILAGLLAVEWNEQELLDLQTQLEEIHSRRLQFLEVHAPDSDLSTPDSTTKLMRGEDILKDPLRTMHKGLRFLNALGEETSFDGQNPIGFLNELSESLGLGQIPPTLLRKNESKSITVRGNASARKHLAADPPPAPQKEVPVILHYDLAKAFSQQIGIPYRAMKVKGGRHQLKGIVTTDDGKSFPIALEDVDSFGSRKDWRSSVARALRRGTCIDITGERKSRIIELDRELSHLLPDLRHFGLQQVTLTLWAGDQTVPLPEDIALENIGAHFQRILSRAD